MTLTDRERQTLCAALEWWMGRTCPVPYRLRHYFEAGPPLTQTEAEVLLATIKKPSHPEGQEGKADA